MISLKKIIFISPLFFLFIIFVSTKAFSLPVGEEEIFERAIKGISCIKIQIFNNGLKTDSYCDIEINEINPDELYENLSKGQVTNFSHTNLPDGEIHEISISGIVCERVYDNNKKNIQTGCEVNEASINETVLFESLTQATHSSYRKRCFKGVKLIDCPQLLH